MFMMIVKHFLEHCVFLENALHLHQIVIFQKDLVLMEKLLDYCNVFAPWMISLPKLIQELELLEKKKTELPKNGFIIKIEYSENLTIDLELITLNGDITREEISLPPLAQIICLIT